MQEEAQLGAAKPLLKKRYFTPVMFLFQLCGLLDGVLGGTGRHCFPQLHHSGCCSSESWVCWVPASELSDPRSGAASALTLLSPQPSWQWSSPQPNLRAEKIQERDPLVSFFLFFLFLHLSDSLAAFLAPAMPPPLLLLWEQCESTYI